MNNLELDLNKIISILGDYKKSGNEYLFQCPYCMDKSKNNFSYNIKKNFLWCFASNGEHSKRWLREVYNKNFSFSNMDSNYKLNSQNIKNINYGAINLENNYRNATYYNNTLLNSQKYLDLLFAKRGLNKSTVKDCYIGVNTKRKNFIFPSIKYDLTSSNLNIVNFEYRQLDLSKNGLYKQKGGLNGLMQINNYNKFTENLIILGGYIDCYSFYQYLCEQNKEKFYHIITSSNGEPSTLKYLEENEKYLSCYKKHYLCLDNDLTGIETMKKIIIKYPFFEALELPKGVKDFNEYVTTL